MEELTGILANVLITLVGLAGTYLVAKVRKYLATKIDANKMAALDNFVNDLCLAAEQLYKKSDPTGELRTKYVEEMLTKAGYVINDVLKAKVQASVYGINLMGGTHESTPTVFN